MRATLIGALLIAAVSTLGDFVWAGLNLRHRMEYGFLHGALLFLCIGGYLGAVYGRPRFGAAAGAAIGALSAGSFYALAPIAGYSVMFVVWAFIWFALAVLVRRLLRATPASWRDTIVRGTVAMAGCGVSFYLISDIWRPFNPRGWDYARHFISWWVAYLPGFAALLLPSPRGTNLGGDSS
jgi:hypothetical protein